MGHYLSDLDELTILCKSETARAYLSEAVACYHAGAFRASIVTTWIAVVFDFIDKLKQLELTGDKNAQTKLAQFEKIRQAGDLKGSLEFERAMLEMARDEFEFITQLEHDDLRRLAEDRNRCAHPSMNSLDEVYQPTAELARYHIRNAVSHMLQRPPVQGKAALDRLVKEVSSQYFPDSPSMAAEYFKSGPLASPRDSLVRNFVVVLLKRVLQEGVEDTKSERRYVAALGAALDMHRRLTEDVIREKLGDIIRGLEDGKLYRCIRLFAIMPIAWDLMQDDICARLANYVRTAPLEQISESVALLLDFEPLKVSIVERIHSADYSDLFALAASEPRLEYVERAISLYDESPNYDTANKRSTLIILLAHCLNAANVERIVKIASENDQIRYSFELERVLSSLKSAGIIPAHQFNSLLLQYGFDDKTIGDESTDDDAPPF